MCLMTTCRTEGEFELLSVNKEVSAYYQRLDDSVIPRRERLKPRENYQTKFGGFSLESFSFEILIAAKTSRFLKKSTQAIQSY